MQCSPCVPISYIMVCTYLYNGVTVVGWNAVTIAKTVHDALLVVPVGLHKMTASHWIRKGSASVVANVSL